MKWHSSWPSACRVPKAQSHLGVCDLGRAKQKWVHPPLFPKQGLLLTLLVTEADTLVKDGHIS